ncbi:MAG TPA: hypothetical protein VKP58_08200 [Candidatus Acidoferrum sp.]|nr:hypothetical protein [Candidatus Acidoferrum sp.]
MATVTCQKCGATTQTDNPLQNCPSCNTPLVESGSTVIAAPKQSVAGNSTELAPAVEEVKAAPAEAPALPQTSAPAPIEMPSPAPSPTPGESMGRKIAEGVEIGLSDVAAVSKLIGDNFSGTPIAAIFKLLGPAAGIGAAVLAQHLTNQGFDLSSLKPAEIL